VAALVRVVQDGTAGEQHRHRVRDVLALQRGRGAVRRLGHRDVDLVVVVEGQEDRLAPAIEPNIGSTRSDRQSPSRFRAG
jgi:hypothetical protein